MATFSPVWTAFFIVLGQFFKYFSLSINSSFDYTIAFLHAMYHYLSPNWWGVYCPVFFAGFWLHIFLDNWLSTKLFSGYSPEVIVLITCTYHHSPSHDMWHYLCPNWWGVSSIFCWIQFLLAIVNSWALEKHCISICQSLAKFWIFIRTNKTIFCWHLLCSLSNIKID